MTDSHPVASTPKPATVEEEDHLYDDVFTEDEVIILFYKCIRAVIVILIITVDDLC